MTVLQPPQYPHGGSGWAQSAWSLAAVLALAVVLRLPVLAVPLDRDEGEYAYIGQRWLLGELPYRDSFDQKPPGTFAAYAVFEAVLGTSPTALHTGALVYSLGIVTVIFVLGRRLFPDPVGTVAAAFGAFLLGDYTVVGNSANTEPFMVLPLTAGLLTALRAVERQSAGWAFMAGLLGAAAISFKQVALPNVGFHTLLLLWAGRLRWRFVAATVTGLACGLLPICGYFAAAGAWSEFWDCTVAHNLAYVSDVPLWTYPLAAVEQLWDSIPTAVPFLAAALIGLTERGSGRPPVAGLGSRSLMAGWLLASLAGVAAGGYFRPHYFIQSIPPVSVLAAAGMWRLSSRVKAGRRPRVVVVLATGTVAFGVWAGWRYYRPESADAKCRSIYHGHIFANSAAVAQVIAERTPADGTVFIFGSEPQILYYAGRKSASRYVIFDPLMGPFADNRRRQLEVIRELSERPPDCIVMVTTTVSTCETSESPRDLRRFVIAQQHAAYRLVALCKPGPSGQADLVTEADTPEAWEQKRQAYAKYPPWTVAVWQRRDPE